MRTGTKKATTMTADEWNALHPIGTPVRYTSVRGRPETARDTKTRSEAWVLGDGKTAIVKVDGVGGGVHLDFLELL